MENDERPSLVMVWIQFAFDRLYILPWKTMWTMPVRSRRSPRVTKVSINPDCSAVSSAEVILPAQNSKKWLFIPFLGEHTTAHRRHQAVDKYFNWLVPDLVTLVCLLDELLKWHKPPPPTTYTFWFFKLRAPPASAWELGLYACSSTAQNFFS